MIKWPWTKWKEEKRARAEQLAATQARKVRIARADCKAVALHKVEISPGELRQKIADEPHYTCLTWDYLLGLVENLYIFDIWISDAGAVPMFVDEITQDNDRGQAPYNEIFFEETGQQQLFTDLDPLWRTPPVDASYPCRLRFFLHYVDPETTLDVAGRHIQLPTPTPLPRWLRDAMPYRPPN